MDKNIYIDDKSKKVLKGPVIDKEFLKKIKANTLSDIGANNTMTVGKISKRDI